MTADQINAVFEFVGAVSTWRNVAAVYRDKGYAGIRVGTIVFFFSWGLWNLWFYPALGQWWSFAGGAMLVLANFAWVAMMMAYGRKQ